MKIPADWLYIALLTPLIHIHTNAAQRGLLGILNRTEKTIKC